MSFTLPGANNYSWAKIRLKLDLLVQNWTKWWYIANSITVLWLNSLGNIKNIFLLQNDYDVGYYTNSTCSFDQPASCDDTVSHHGCSSLKFLESSLKHAQKVQDHFGKHVDKKKHKIPSQVPCKPPPTTERRASVQYNYVTINISDSRVNVDSKG